MTSNYGGPHAAENDTIDEALRNGTIDELDPEVFSQGAQALIESYKDESIFETPVGEFVLNTHPSEGLEEEAPVEEEEKADAEFPGFDEL